MSRRVASSPGRLLTSAVALKFDGVMLHPECAGPLKKGRFSDSAALGLLGFYRIFCGRLQAGKAGAGF